MDYSLVDSDLICWRLAHTYCEYYPPEESVEACLSGGDFKHSGSQSFEHWYHSQICESYRQIIEQLYGAGVDVWKRGQDYVDNEPLPEPMRAALELPSRPSTFETVSTDAVAVDDAIQDALTVVDEHVRDAPTLKDQLVWGAILKEMTTLGTYEIGELLRGTAKLE
jgi:hypothetical protein